jgi:hypothetical protein
MTSFDLIETPSRPAGAGGDILIAPITGLDDIHLTDDARNILAIFYSKTKGARPIERRDFTPADLKKYLPHVMIFDVGYLEDGQANDAVIRLLGSTLAEYYGEYTGRSVLEHPSQSGNRALLAINMSLENEHCPIVVTVSQTNPELPLLDIRGVYIPIAGENGKIQQGFMHTQMFDRQGRPFATV